MTTTQNPASAAQIKFVTDLLGKRVVPEEVAQAIKSAQVITSRQASSYIDLLKTYPFKPSGNDTLAEYLAAFEGVEDSKYAVPMSYFAAVLPELKGSGDLIFLEVKTWKGRRYLNQLHGSLGEFTRTRFPMAVGKVILSVLARRHVEFAKLFGEKFVCCGRCASPLTDQRSREIHIGPECRKVWGL